MGRDGDLSLKGDCPLLRYGCTRYYLRYLHALTSSVRNLLNTATKKRNQAQGLVIDLTNTPITRKQLPANLLNDLNNRFRGNHQFSDVQIVDFK